MHLIALILAAIAFIPMDDRPVTAQLPVMLGQILPGLGAVLIQFRLDHRQALGQFSVHRQGMAQADENPDDLDVHRNRLLTVQDAGKHRHAVLSKDEREVTAAAVRT